MTKIIDLDALVPDDKQVKFGGVTYVVPGDMPLETYLKVSRVAQLQEAEDVDEQEVVGAMVNALLDLFSYKLEGDVAGRRDAIESTIRSRGLGAVTDMLGAIYGADDEPEASGDEVEADPPTPATSNG